MYLNNKESPYVYFLFSPASTKEATLLDTERAMRVNKQRGVQIRNARKEKAHSQYTCYNRGHGFDLILLSNPPRVGAYRSLVSGCVRSFSSY